MHKWPQLIYDARNNARLTQKADRKIRGRHPTNDRSVGSPRLKLREMTQSQHDLCVATRFATHYFPSKLFTRATAPTRRSKKPEIGFPQKNAFHNTFRNHRTNSEPRIARTPT